MLWWPNGGHARPRPGTPLRGLDKCIRPRCQCGRDSPLNPSRDTPQAGPGGAAEPLGPTAGGAPHRQGFGVAGWATTVWWPHQRVHGYGSGSGSAPVLTSDTMDDYRPVAASWPGTRGPSQAWRPGPPPCTSGRNPEPGCPHTAVRDITTPPMSGRSLTVSLLCLSGILGGMCAMFQWWPS